MTKSINHQLFFPHPPEAVWEYLTRADLMELWLMKNDFQPIVGHEFQFRTNPIPQMEFDGICYCKVLEVAPYERLSYSWKAGAGDGKMTLDSIVIWRLEKRENGTELILEHNGFSEAGNIILYNAMNEGWRSNMHKISDKLNIATNATASA